MFMCTNCHNSFTVNTSTKKCPIASCNNELVYIDCLISPIIKKFWEIGCMTKSCRAGFPYEHKFNVKSVVLPKIKFTNDIKTNKLMKLLIDQVPALSPTTHTNQYFIDTRHYNGSAMYVHEPVWVAAPLADQYIMQHKFMMILFELIELMRINKDNDSDHLVFDLNIKFRIYKILEG